MRKIALFSGLVVAVSAACATGVIYINKKAETEIESFVIQNGLKDIVSYADLSYSVISGTLKVDNLSIHMLGGNLLVDELVLNGVRDISNIPENISLELTGVVDNTGLLAPKIDGPGGGIDKITRYNSIRFGLDQKNDYRFGYSYENESVLDFSFSMKRKDQYEFSMENEISGLNQRDFEYANRIFHDLKTSVRMATRGRREANDIFNWFGNAFDETPSLEYRKVRDWQRDFSSRALFKKGFVSIEDHGYLNLVDNAFDTPVYFPDEDASLESFKSVREKFLDNLISDWDFSDLNGVQREHAFELMDTVKVFFEGGKTMEILTEPDRPIPLLSFLDNIDKERYLMDLISQEIIQIEVN